MIAYCVDVSGSVSNGQILAALAWIRDRLQPEDRVIAFDSSAHLLSLEDFQLARHPTDPSGRGATCAKETFELVRELAEGSTIVVVSDGYFLRDGLPPFEGVDIARLPEVHPLPEM